MRKLITLIAILVTAATTMMAQNYDSNHKYSFWSNLSIGGSISYNRAVFTDNTYNIGMDLRMTKRIHDNWRIRGIADINGFIGNGFDRYGKLMAGVSLDFMPFYLFADYGTNYNPDNLGHQKFGMAMDGGIGLGWDYFHVEAGIDRVNNGSYWQSNTFAKVGVDIPLGITEKDRVNISMDNNMRENYGNLRTENKELKDEIVRMQTASQKMEEAVENMSKLFNDLKAKYDECESRETYVCLKDIYFDYASDEPNEIGWTNLGEIATAILSSNDNYIIEGYCSRNGNPESNQRLSERRAQTVYDILVEQFGVSRARLSCVGHGMTDRDTVGDQKVTVRKSN